MSSLYGTAESVAGNSATRTAGAGIFALGVLAWLGKRYDARIVCNIVVPVMFVWFLLKSAVAYSAFVGGVFKPSVALTVLFSDMTLTVVYAYFLFVGRKELRQR